MQIWSGCVVGNEGSRQMRVLVTGADGFVGRYLIARLVQTGHEVTAACRPADAISDHAESWNRSVRVVPFELSEPAVVRQATSKPQDAVIHLAAIASVREAREDPGRAWEINAAGTARLLDAIIAARDGTGSDPVVLIVSSSEVYGAGPSVPRTESDPLQPQSPYAASKVGAEVAGFEAWRRTGLRVIVARPFTHTGPRQPPAYVIPSFVARLWAVKHGAPRRVPTGNLEPVRDLLDVRDVVEAYLHLLSGGAAGETYNIARGTGITLRELFTRIAEIIGVEAEPFTDPSLRRAEDIPYLVGDSSKLRNATGWTPTIMLEQTLREMVDAQAN
jgi:GDP-4-dehydro-6-deoxy-D-mannose reductase